MTNLAIKAQPREPAWRKLHALAVRAEPELRRGFLQAVAQVRNGTRIAAVSAALEAGQSADEVLALVPWEQLGEPVIRDQLVRNLRTLYERAGDATAVLLSEEAEFSIVSDRAARFVSEHGAELVLEVRDGTREGLRVALADALADATDRGLSAQATARTIRDRIGLLPRDVEAVRNLRERMAAQGFTRARIAQDAAAKERQLLQARALNIARTEATIAASAGQREAWEQAIDDGLMERTMRREWIAVITESCDQCIGLDGEVVGFDEPFSGGAMEPPAHPSCRCVVDLVEGDESAKAAARPETAEQLWYREHPKAGMYAWLYHIAGGM